MENLARNTKVYLDQPHVKIVWISQDNSMHVEWKSNPSHEVYQEALAIQRQVIRAHRCLKVVFDNKGLKNGLSLPQNH